jgi:hypothetical protein
MRVSLEQIKVAADKHGIDVSDVDEGNSSVKEWRDTSERRKQNYSLKYKKDECL